jgi:iron-sulfur cluster repair protein YtfE (RIC family)
MVEQRVEAASDGVTGVLGLDHRRLDAILADAKHALAAGDFALASARFAVFRDSLARHIVVEEEIVFPAFESLAGPSAGGPTQVMRAEHRELRRLMAEIAASLARGGDEERATPLAALTARIYAHNGKEERILYPLVDRVAREAGALDSLVARVRSGVSGSR